MNKKTFKPNLKILIFYVFFSIVFIALGFWQIERGINKTELLQQFETRSKAEASAINDEPKKWDRVKLSGEFFDSFNIYIDNVILKGIPGYKILTPAKVEGINEPVLVDRGWIQRETSREVLPDVSISKIDFEVAGILISPELGLVLGDEIITKTKPYLSQSSNIEVIEKGLEIEFYDFIFLADPLMIDSLEYIEIIPTNILPSKHYGYASQWFTMFLVLTFMFILTSFKNEE
jgi:surfeit locus 1 family protein